MSNAASAAPPPEPQQVIDLCGDEGDSVDRRNEAIRVVAFVTKNHETISLVDDDAVRGSPLRRQRHQHSKENEREIFFLDASPGMSSIRARKAKRAARKAKHRNFEVTPSSTAASSVARAPGVIDLEQPGAAFAAAIVPPAPPRTPLEAVMDVFPDVHPNHAQMLIQQHGNPLMVVSILAESQYPKSKTTPSGPRVDDGVHLHGNKRKREYQYDFMSSSSFAPSPDYTAQAQAQILQDFPFISVNCSRELLKEIGKGHYAICFDEICKRVMGGLLSQDGDEQENQYRLLKSAVNGIPLSVQQHKRLMCRQRRMTVSKPRRVPKVAAILNEILLEEIGYVKQKESEWMEEVNMRLARKQNRAAAEKAGATMECPCCCFDVALDEMIACREEGHLFCVDCLKRFAENQIFSMGSFGVDRRTKKPATDLLCMHSDGCSSGFDIAHLRKALPDKIMEKYNELQYQAVVDAAGIELFSCPKCGIQAELPSTQMIFECPDVDCALETCRNCLEPAHIPLKCSEVEKKSETKGRLKVEEAITAAKIRTCPKLGCGSKYVKSDGCNKMTCPKCQTWSCYICRALVPKDVGYKHFCQTPHCQHGNCKKCPLYSKVEEDDVRAMREAGYQAAEEVRGQSLLVGALAEVSVDVDSILKDVEVPRQLVMRRR